MLRIRYVDDRHAGVRTIRIRNRGPVIGTDTTRLRAVQQVAVQSRLATRPESNRQDARCGECHRSRRVDWRRARSRRRRSADWDEYDRITEADKRVAMILRPEHMYGSALARMQDALKK